MFAKVIVLCTAAVLVKAGLPVGPAGYGYGYGGLAPALAAPVAKVAAPAFAAPAFAAPAIAAPAFAAPAYGAPLVAGPAVAKVAAVPAAVKVAAPIYPEIPQPYSFGYNLQTEDGGAINRQEVSDENNSRKGSYGYMGPDGIYRQVNYVADAAGYRATIETNEPGTANQNPAAVGIAASEPPYKVLPAAAPVVKAAFPVAAAAPVIKAAPAFAAPAYAAPAFAAPVVKAPLGYGYGGPVVKAPLAYGAAAPVAAYSAPPVYASKYPVSAAVAHPAPVYAAGKYGYY